MELKQIIPIQLIYHIKLTLTLLQGCFLLDSLVKISIDQVGQVNNK